MGARRNFRRGGGKPKKPPPIKDKRLPSWAPIPLNAPPASGVVGGGGWGVGDVPPGIVNVNAIFNKWYKK